MATKTAIISAAFYLLRGKQVNDITPDVADAQIQGASDIYDIHLKYVLTCYPWRFAMITRELVQLAGTPLSYKFQYAFQLPVDLLLPYRTEPLINYEIFEDTILTNVDELKLDYITNVEESRFPPYFVEFLIDSLAERLAMPITQDITIEQVFAKKAERSFLLAKSIDSTIMPSPVIQRDPLIAARTGYRTSFMRGCG